LQQGQRQGLSCQGPGQDFIFVFNVSLSRCLPSYYKFAASVFVRDWLCPYILRSRMPTSSCFIWLWLAERCRGRTKVID